MALIDKQYFGRPRPGEDRLQVDHFARLNEFTLVKEPERIFTKTELDFSALYTEIFDRYFNIYSLETLILYSINFPKQYFGTLFYTQPCLKFYLFNKKFFYFFYCIFLKLFKISYNNFYSGYGHNFFSRLELYNMGVDFSDFEPFFFSDPYPKVLVLLPEFFLVWADVLSFYSLRLSVIHLRFSLYNEHLAGLLPLYPKIRRLFIMRLDKFCHTDLEVSQHLYFLFYRRFLVFRFKSTLASESFVHSFVWDPVYQFFFSSKLLNFFSNLKSLMFEFSKKFRLLLSILFYFNTNLLLLQNRGFRDLLKFPIRRFFEFFYFLPNAIHKYFFLLWYHQLEKKIFNNMYETFEFLSLNILNSFFFLITKNFWNIFFFQFTQISFFFYIPYISSNIKPLFLKHLETKYYVYLWQHNVMERLKTPFKIKQIFVNHKRAFLFKIFCYKRKVWISRVTDLFMLSKRRIKGGIPFYMNSGYFVTPDFIYRDYDEPEFDCIFDDIPFRIISPKFINSYKHSIRNNTNLSVWEVPWGGSFWIINERQKDFNFLLKQVRDIFQVHAITPIIDFYLSSASYLDLYNTKVLYDYTIFSDWIYYESFITFEFIETFFSQLIFHTYLVFSNFNIEKFFISPVLGIFQIYTWFVCTFVDILHTFHYILDFGFVFYLNRILLDSFHINHIYSLFIFSKHLKFFLNKKSKKTDVYIITRFSHLLGFYYIRDIFFKYFTGNLKLDLFILILLLEKKKLLEHFNKIFNSRGKYYIHYGFMLARYRISIPEVDTYFPPKIVF